MAEGNTREGLETWILMLNPNDVPSDRYGRPS